MRHPRSFWHQVKVGCLAALLPQAPRVRGPVLLAWGRRDHTMPLSCAARLREHLPCAQVYVGAGSHDWLVTEPREFTRAVLAFARGKERQPGDEAVRAREERTVRKLSE